MAQLGIEMIPAYSPEARGRSERAFRTHQARAHQVKMLKGRDGYRLRVGKWRVIFDVDGTALEVFEVGAQGNIYSRSVK